LAAGLHARSEVALSLPSSQNMQNMQCTPGYAESQIRVLLKDLADSTHSTRVKAVTKFKDYIDKFRPEVYDDDVEYLFIGGSGGGKLPNGLFYYAGQSSSKHEGELKRICAPVIDLIRWLISIDMGDPSNDQHVGNNEHIYDNIFYDQYISMPVSELCKINFTKHILLPSTSNSRSGSQEYALELLSVLLRDHRDLDGNFDSVDADDFLDNNQHCKDLLTAYLSRTNAEELTKNVSALRQKQMQLAANTDNRPTTWDELVGKKLFKLVPIQEGEGVPVDDNADNIITEERAVRDPLGLTELDLRATQELHAAGAIRTQTMQTTSGGFHARRQHIIAKNAMQANRKKQAQPVAAQNDDDDDNSDSGHFVADGSGGARADAVAISSVLPDDKTFSPELFLTLVHGNASFEQLQSGSSNLQKLLLTQENHREALVRANFGLFVHCAEGLEWLKEYRRNPVGKSPMMARQESTAAGAAANPFDDEDEDDDEEEDDDDELHLVQTHTGAQRGEMKLSQAQASLDAAKAQAQRTLAPILDRMKRSRMIRSTEQVIKRLSSALEYPHAMRVSLQKGDMEECCAIYSRVLAMSANSSSIAQRVQQNCYKLVLELRDQCVAAVGQPNTSFVSLSRYVRVLALLEGADTYRDRMRSCFATQLQYFNTMIAKLVQRFLSDVNEAAVHAASLHAERKRVNALLRHRKLPNVDVNQMSGAGKIKSARMWRPSHYKMPVNALGELAWSAASARPHSSGTIDASASKRMSTRDFHAPAGSRSSAVISKGPIASNLLFGRNSTGGSRHELEDAPEEQSEDSDAGADGDDKADSGDEDLILASMNAPIVTKVNGHNKVVGTVNGTFSEGFEGFDIDEEDEDDDDPSTPNPNQRAMRDRDSGSGSPLRTGKSVKKGSASPSLAGGGRPSDEEGDSSDASRHSSDSDGEGEDGRGKNKRVSKEEAERIARQAVLDEEAHLQDCCIMGNIVRELHLLRLLDAVDLWMPCLHSIVVEVTTASQEPSRGTGAVSGGSGAPQNTAFGRSFVPASALNATTNTTLMTASSSAGPNNSQGLLGLAAQHLPIQQLEVKGAAGGASNVTSHPAPPAKRGSVTSIATASKGKAASAATDASNIMDRKSSSILQRSKVKPLTHMMAVALLYVSEAVNQTVRGFNSQTSHADQREEDTLFQPELGVKEKAMLFGHERVVLGGRERKHVTSTYLSSQAAYNEQLKNAFLVRAMREVGRTYEDLVNVVLAAESGPSGATGTSRTDLFGMGVGAMSAVGGISTRNPYFEPLQILKAISRQGEQSIADRAMNRLARHCIAMFENGYAALERRQSEVHPDDVMRGVRSNAPNTIALIGNGGKTSQMNGFGSWASQFPTSNTSTGDEEVSKYSMLHLLDGLERRVQRSLQRVSESIIRPEWVQNDIYCGVLGVFIQFVNNVVRVSFDSRRLKSHQTSAAPLNNGVVETERSARMKRASYVKGSIAGGGASLFSRRASSKGVTIGDISINSSMSAMLIELNNLAEEQQIITHDYIYGLDRGEELLELLRLSITLRTTVLPRVWMATIEAFPTESLAALMQARSQAALAESQGGGGGKPTSITPSFASAPHAATGATTAAPPAHSHGSALHALFGSINENSPQKAEEARPETAKGTRGRSESVDAGTKGKAVAEGQVERAKAKKVLPLEQQLWDSCLAHPAFEQLIPMTFVGEGSDQKWVEKADKQEPALPTQANQSLHEAVNFESKVVYAYVAYRVTELEVTVAASYSVSMRNETFGLWEKPKPPSELKSTDPLAQLAGSSHAYGSSRLPPHLVRVLAALGQEKSYLLKRLGHMCMKRGFSGSGQAEAKARERDEATESFEEDVVEEKSPTGTGGSNTGADRVNGYVVEPYARFLFREICGEVLEVYVSLIEFIKENRTFEDAASGGSSPRLRAFSNLGTDESASSISSAHHQRRPACRTPLSLGRAVEEARFLKEVLLPQDRPQDPLSHRGLLALARLNEQLAEYDEDVKLYRKANPRSGRRYAASKFLSYEQLKVEGRIMSMILNDV
jgi:hypothetical protein